MGDINNFQNMLNSPAGSQFEIGLGMNVSGAKADDGSVSMKETINIMGQFAEKLVEKKLISTDIDPVKLEEKKNEIREELGADAKSFDALPEDQQNAIAAFSSLSDNEREAVMQNAWGKISASDQTQESYAQVNLDSYQPLSYENTQNISNDFGVSASLATGMVAFASNGEMVTPEIGTPSIIENNETITTTPVIGGMGMGQA